MSGCPSNVRGNLFFFFHLGVLCRNVIWLADTNYRIDMENAEVRALAEADNLDPLFVADQASRLYGTGAAAEFSISSDMLWIPVMHLAAMKKDRYCFDQRTVTTWARMSTIRARKCAFLLGQVVLFHYLSSTELIPYGRKDRILYRGLALDLTVYSRAELRGSDHKPGK